MPRRRTNLSELWLRYINQSTSPTEDTMRYVEALKSRIDALELEKASLTRELKTKGESL